MLTIDDMQTVVEDIASELPDIFFARLNGGILLLEDTMLSPEAVDEDLYTMGEYCEDPLLGSYIILYYGSFAEICQDMSPEEIRAEIRDTLLHEFTHHLESLAGEHGLEITDNEELAAYLAKSYR